MKNICLMIIATILTFSIAQESFCHNSALTTYRLQVPANEDKDWVMDVYLAKATVDAWLATSLGAKTKISEEDYHRRMITYVGERIQIEKKSDLNNFHGSLISKSGHQINLQYRWKSANIRWQERGLKFHFNAFSDVSHHVNLLQIVTGNIKKRYLFTRKNNYIREIKIGSD